MWFHELALRGMCRERRGSVLAYDKYKSLGNEDPAKKKDYKRQHGISKAWLSANLSILCMNTCVVPPKRQELCLHSLNPHPDIRASGIMLSLFTYWVFLIPHNILVKSDWPSLLSSWGSVYISIPIFQFFHLHFPLDRVYMSVLYVCISIPALQVGSSVLLSHKKEWNWVIFRDTNGPRVFHTDSLLMRFQTPWFLVGLSSWEDTQKTMFSGVNDRSQFCSCSFSAVVGTHCLYSSII